MSLGHIYTQANLVDFKSIGRQAGRQAGRQGTLLAVTLFRFTIQQNRGW